MPLEVLVAKPEPEPEPELELESKLELELDAFAPIVLDAVGAAVVLDGAAAPPVFKAPAVITTGMYEKSVPVKVSVLEPGSFASLPPKDSVQTADDAPREQSM